MDPATLAVIGKAVGTAGSLYGAYSSYQAGKEAEDLREDQRDEDIRRAAASDRAEMAENRARLAASGVQSTGSPLRYMGELEKEQRLQRAWTRRAGSAEAKAYRDQGTSDAIGSLTRIPGYWT